jgi:DNA-binding transcriptional ArsR family regulator
VPQRGTAELTAAQRRALLVLASELGTSLTRTEYARLTGVTRSQASHDLSELVSAGLVVRVGRGRSARHWYELTPEPAAQQVWTPGRTRRKLVWALVGVAALAALGAAARGLPLVATHGFGSAIQAITGATAPVKPPSAHGSGDESFRPRRPAPTVATTHAGLRAPKPERITRSAAKPAAPVQQTQQRTYVSNVGQTVPAHTAPASSETSSATATPLQNGHPPLPAPAGASPPSPLKAP